MVLPIPAHTAHGMTTMSPSLQVGMVEEYKLTELEYSYCQKVILKGSYIIVFKPVEYTRERERENADVISHSINEC